MSQLGEDDLDSLEQSPKPTATLNATKWDLHKFAAWMEKRNLTCDWASIWDVDNNRNNVILWGVSRFLMALR